MTEKELIAKIQTLNKIKPNKEWAVLIKNEILQTEAGKQEQVGADKSFFERMSRILRFGLNHKYAFSLALSVLAISIFIFNFYLAGNVFSPVQDEIASQEENIIKKEKLALEIKEANERLTELEKAVQENNKQKIKPVINKYQAAVSELAKSLAKESDKDKIKKAVREVKKLEEKEKQIKSLGIELGENIEKDVVLVKLITQQIKDLEKRIEKMSPEDKKLIEEIKNDLIEKKLTDALEKLLILNNNHL